jgi:hypothetical protein
VLLAQFLFGWIHGWAYGGARRGSRSLAFVYGVLMYPLTMQFFQDQYFGLLSTWVQAVLLLLAALWWESHGRTRDRVAIGEGTMGATAGMGLP